MIGCLINEWAGAAYASAWRSHNAKWMRDSELSASGWLTSIAVDVSPVANFDNMDDEFVINNLIKDSVVTLPYPILFLSR